MVLIAANRDGPTFAATRPSVVLLEQLSVCVSRAEPVLLVGETGTGKTSTVQYLAKLTGELRKPAKPWLKLDCFSPCLEFLGKNKNVQMSYFALIYVHHCVFYPGHRLRVVNMNQQSDTADLLGGWEAAHQKSTIGRIRDVEILWAQFWGGYMLLHVINIY